jgi:sRNA-binding protein
VLRGGARYDLNGNATARLENDHSKDQALKRRTARAAKLRRIAAEKVDAAAAGCMKSKPQEENS